MHALTNETRAARIEQFIVADEALTVDLSDGRTVNRIN